jgi:hypothetical protein
MLLHVDSARLPQVIEAFGRRANFMTVTAAEGFHNVDLDAAARQTATSTATIMSCRCEFDRRGALPATVDEAVHAPVRSASRLGLPETDPENPGDGLSGCTTGPRAASNRQISQAPSERAMAMKVKGANFFELHIEKIVLAVVAVGLRGRAGAPARRRRPYAVTVNGPEASRWIRRTSPPRILHARPAPA